METTNNEIEVQPVNNVAVALPEFDNNMAKKLAAMIASKIPQIGGVLSGLINVFWPTTEVSVWDQIKEQVEKLINQKISEYNLERQKQVLAGIKLNILQYKPLTDRPQRLAKLVAIETLIETNLPWFMAGDPKENFTCFWGLALLHLTVRKEICLMVPPGQNDAANDELLRKYVAMYCEYGRVALSRMHNSLINPIDLTYSCMNEPGKVSNLRIDVDLQSNTTGQSLFAFHKLYRRNEWDNSTIPRENAVCNQGISSGWDHNMTDLNQKFASWAFDGIRELEANFTWTKQEVLDQLRIAMMEADYNNFVKYYGTQSIYHTPVGVTPSETTRAKPGPIHF